MASSIARVLRRPVSVISGQAVCQDRSAILVHFSSEAPTPPSKGGSEAPMPPSKTDALLMNTLDDVTRKFKIAHEILRKEKIIIDPDDSNAVSRYMQVMKTMREKTGLYDDLGIEKMRMDALDKVEKQLKKPLMRNDKKGMALLEVEFNAINKKVGISVEDLPKYEQKLEHDVAKAQLEDLKKNALEAMEEQKKRLGYKDEDVDIDVRTLDIRNFL
ncbi:probable ATP synthase 24 kDa subunit, mitochondrial isoform X2 [Cryptomeria japonica]|uniref:probable ATP synthase 24 kDa subunit, mitochondrial isoform X2 n=1 Tax=Cryptomeria japonica TaxID=3369 RepID=UPI0027DA78F7|nr:probable ATP synthase 24 kDa subunit, mitochondrial isoform X2 [Cryptomeria japonica]